MLPEDEHRGGNPVDESTCRPLVGEGQMEKLEDLEERAEAVNEPVFVVLGNAELDRENCEKRGGVLTPRFA